MGKRSLCCVCLLAAAQTSWPQIAQRTQLQMSLRDHGRPLVQFRPDESPAWRKQNQMQSNGFCFVALQMKNKEHRQGSFSDDCNVLPIFKTNVGNEMFSRDNVTQCDFHDGLCIFYVTCQCEVIE